MSKEEALAHGKKYSKSFSSGVWNSDPDAMGRKTCLKLLLSKFGILSIELQRAIKFDQGVVKGDFSQMESIEDIDAVEVDYIDNPQNGVDEQKAADVAKKFEDFESDTKGKKEGK
jgi:recombination protein RecT